MTPEIRSQFNNLPKLHDLEERRARIKTSFTPADLLNPVTKRSIILALANIKREKARL